MSLYYRKIEKFYLALIGDSLVSYKRFIQKDVVFLQLRNNYIFSDLLIWNFKYSVKPLHHKDIQRMRSKFQKLLYNEIKVSMKSI